MRLGKESILKEEIIKYNSANRLSTPSHKKKNSFDNSPKLEKATS